MGSINFLPKQQILGLRLFSIALSSVIIVFILTLMTIQNRSLFIRNEPKPIAYSQFDVEFTPPKPLREKEIENLKAKIEPAKAPSKPTQLTQAPAEQINPNIRIKLEGASISPIVPRNSNSSSGISPAQVPNIANSNGNNIPLPKLAAPTQNTIFLAECEKADPQERPIGCPVNAKVKKTVEILNGPRYRPERVQGHKDNEVNAKYFAGWRERCQTNEGYQAQVCIPIGKKPPRVKTPQELCLEQGLSHCNGVPMPRREITQEKQ